MSSTDKLQITIDEYSEKFEPSESQLDPVNKFRTSTPQALIDTDFEYGVQGTKWETAALNNMRPFFTLSSVGSSSNILLTTFGDLRSTADTTETEFSRAL